MVTAEAGPGKTIAVVGDGAVGLCAVLAAKALGSERVIAFSRHEDRAALAVYADHPAHCKVKEFVHSVICERVCCDYEV